MPSSNTKRPLPDTRRPEKRLKPTPTPLKTTLFSLPLELRQQIYYDAWNATPDFAFRYHDIWILVSNARFAFTRTIGMPGWLLANKAFLEEGIGELLRTRYFAAISEGSVLCSRLVESKENPLLMNKGIKRVRFVDSTALVATWASRPKLLWSPSQEDGLFVKFLERLGLKGLQALFQLDVCFVKGKEEEALKEVYEDEVDVLKGRCMKVGFEMDVRDAWMEGGDMGVERVERVERVEKAKEAAETSARVLLSGEVICCESRMDSTDRKLVVDF